MEEVTTTDEGVLKLRWKVVFPVIGFLLLVSNGFTRYVSVQDQHGEQIQYNQDANKRRTKNAVIILKLEIEISVLKKELQYCKKKQE